MEMQCTDSRPPIETQSVPLRYTFIHPPGYFHIRLLGEGAQGSACLVRNVYTGQYCVRKRRDFEDEVTVQAEGNYGMLLAHPHIIKCVGKETYPNEANLKEQADATYWPYYNCLSLYHLRAAFYKAEIRMPEIIIWRYLNQTFAALHYLHFTGLEHGDLHPGNIFVDWHPDATVPEFVLGDLGFVGELPGGYFVRSPYPADLIDDDEDKEPIPLAEILAQSNRFHIDQPYPSLEDLELFDEHEAVTTRVEVPFFLENIGKEFGDLKDNFRELFKKPSSPWPTKSVPVWDDEASSTAYKRQSPADNEYSPADPIDDTFYSHDLQQVWKKLLNMQEFMRSSRVLTFPRYKHIFDLLHQEIASGEMQAWTRLMHDIETVRGLDTVRDSLLSPENQPGMPKLFVSIEELENCGFRPPGPWLIAVVDGYTGQFITTTDNQSRDLENCGPRDAAGVAGKVVTKEPWFEEESTADGGPSGSESEGHRTDDGGVERDDIW